jgi:hypothetical protein
MAEIIPALNKQTLGRMTSGEKRLARRFESLLEDDYLVWYDIPIGSKRRYPDFIVLHPSRGLLFLEVKDWKPETIKRLRKSDVSLLTENGMVTRPHPLEQARQYAYAVIATLSRDPRLCQAEGPHKGQLIIPYGWGVVFTNITRNQIHKGIPGEVRASLLPDHLVIYKDEMTESVEAEPFQEQLWGMFHYRFGKTLTLPQIDRIRWHLFPEIRIDDVGQTDLFAPQEESASPKEPVLPDIIKIMDIQQEQLARSLGEGHRVIHGVAGSGKTMILGYRCLYLAQALSKPILVLCFNITLAAKLRAFISAKGIGGQVQVYHFHDWCGEQLKTYHVTMPASDKPYYERQVEAVIDGVEKGHIPRGQYGALLIDEGHDFDAEWLKLVVQMVDPDTNSLLLLYDDAQSIYKKSSGLGFTLSSVGVQAQGRTTVLRLNYRNTREILGFAYAFAKDYLDPHSADDDHIPIVEPEAAGTNGPEPVVRTFGSLSEEMGYTVAALRKWHEQGVPWSDMAVLCVTKYQGREFSAKLSAAAVPHTWLDSKASKGSYDPATDQVAVLTIHSSKGLEFPRVIIVGVGQLSDSGERQQQDARLLYVGMTRAQQCLLMTTSANNEYSRRLMLAASTQQ